MALHPLAGQKAPRSFLVNVPRLVSCYYELKPDASDPTQRVAFGTSGHRGSAFKAGFNEDHILATSQAIVEHRRAHGIDGPLFLGMDTHALSEPALVTALEVFAAQHQELQQYDTEFQALLSKDLAALNAQAASLSEANWALAGSTLSRIFFRVS